MENRALGKGLSALIPANEKKEGEEQKETVVLMKTSVIKNNSLQPRTNYDDAKLEELKASIKEKGVLQPILVREKDEDYEVVAGERRLRVARALNLQEVPVLIKQVSDKDALVISLVENIQREELNPIEEAEAFRSLIEEFQYSQEEVAQAVGKDRSTISNLLRLLKLPQDIQSSLYNGDISMGHARALLSVEPMEDQKKILEQIVRRQLSVRELENIVREIKPSRGKKNKTIKQKDHEIAALEDDLQKTLGTKVQVVAKKKRGKIVIEYYSLDDLDRILKILRK